MEVETRTNEIIYNEIISLKIKQDVIIEKQDVIIDLLKLIKKDVAYDEDDGDYDDDAWHSLSDSAEDDFVKLRKKLKTEDRIYDPRFDFHPLRYPNQQ